MKLPPRPSPATDLKLRGTSGRFEVMRPDEVESEDDSTPQQHAVRFLQTQVSLDTNQQENVRLLKTLGPVREVFPVEQLGFDELLQRDLDDARVSTQLIPYLLRPQGGKAVRFFPPIIAMLLPVDPASGRPLRYYHPIEVETDYDESIEASVQTMRSGPLGGEHFYVRQPVMGSGELNWHDFNSVHINSNTTRLVIIDGQHRAMALLALFRNQNAEGWRDPSQEVFQNFYNQWDQSTLSNYDLSGLQLPLTVLYMPSLAQSEDEGRRPDYDLVQASRAIFLALNKNARPVTTARNRLLDDADLVAELMRGALTSIKAQEAVVPLWAVELDTSSDQTRIVSPVSISSVNALYYSIEHMLFGGEADVVSSGKRSGNFPKRTRLRQASRMLGVAGLEESDRHRYDKDTAAHAADRFVVTYGYTVIQAMSRFDPYACWLTAHRRERERLKEQGNRIAERMLYEAGTMRESADFLHELYHDHWNNVFPTLKTAEEQVSESTKRSRGEASGLVVDKIENLDSASREPLRAIMEGVLDNYRTTAFQAGVYCTFVEVLSELADELGVSQKDPTEARKACVEAFGPYIDSLNEYFAPSRVESVPGLLQFFGEEIPEGLKGAPAPVSEEGAAVSHFRALIVPGELQPDMWPAWRYVMLELWLRLASGRVYEVVERKLMGARPRVAGRAEDRAEGALADAMGVKKGSLQPEHLAQAAERARKNYHCLLLMLGVSDPVGVVEQAFANSESNTQT